MAILWSIQSRVKNFNLDLSSSPKYSINLSEEAKTNSITSPIDKFSFKIQDETRGGVEHVFQKEEKIELLYICINKLGKDERAIILLHLDERKYDEIAEIIG